MGTETITKEGLRNDFRGFLIVRKDNAMVSWGGGWTYDIVIVGRSTHGLVEHIATPQIENRQWYRHKGEALGSGLICARSMAIDLASIEVEEQDDQREKS